MTKGAVVSTLKQIEARNAPLQKTKCPGRLKNGAKCKRTAGASTQHVGWGLCSLHGGLEPAGIRAAALAESRFLGQTFATSISTDPQQALVDELARTHGAVAWLQLRIDDRLAGMELEGEDPLDYLVGPEGMALRKMYESERDRLVRISTVCLNLGLKARELRLAEQMGSMIQRVLELTLQDLMLTPEQRDAARPILAAHLQHAARTVAVEGTLVP